MAKETILLIEDNPLQAKQTREIVEKAGYTVVVTETGSKGFKAAKFQGIDLILLDLVLPDFSGERVCQWIKRDESLRAIPIIMLTAKSSAKEKIAGFESGADDYLAKPFDADELIARIKAFLRITRLQNELKSKNEELEKALREVELKAITDSGTGLFNRRHFYNLLDKEFVRARRFSEPMSLLMLDIEHFKMINDTYGHQVGDSVLLEVADLMKDAVRLIEVAARYGGEEFVLLLPKTSASEAIKPANRIREAMAGHRFKGIPAKRKITLSIGIASLPDPAISRKDDLVRCADLALYKAKKKGRNRTETATGEDLEDPED